MLDVSVPFELDVSNHIFVQSVIAGSRFTAVVDTGAGLNAIDQRAAKTLGLQFVGASTSAGMTGNIATRRVLLPAIDIGSRKLAASPAAVVDLADISSSIGRAVEIVLGRQFFENSLVHIDFSRLLLTIQQPGNQPLPHRANALPLTTRDNGRLYTMASVESAPSSEAMYDLGSGIPLYVSQRFADQMELLAGRVSSQTASAGAEGMTVSTISTIKQLTIGGVVLSDVPVQVPPSWNQEAPILIGLPVWRRFQNYIDVDGGRLGLSPDSHLVNAAFPRDRSGIGAQRLADRLVVVFVSPKSPAEQAGVRPGDEVVALDGVPCGPVLYAARPRPGTEAAGTVQTLQLSSGKKLVVTLRDYF